MVPGSRSSLLKRTERDAVHSLESVPKLRMCGGALPPLSQTSSLRGD